MTFKIIFETIKKMLKLDRFVSDEKTNQELSELIAKRDYLWKKALKDVDLTEEICAEVITLYLTGKNKTEDAGVSVHICVNRPPCKDTETEQKTRGRKWCKSRNTYGTKKFDEEAKKALKIYNSIIRNRAKNIRQNFDKSLIPNMQEESKDLDRISAKFYKLVKDMKKMGIKREIPEDEKDEKDEESEEDRKFRERYNDLKSSIGKSSLMGLTKKLQEKKAKNACKGSVITLVRDSMIETKTQLENDNLQRNDEESDAELKESKKYGVDAAVQDSLEKLTKTIQNLDSRLVDIEKNTNAIDKKQDKILDLAENIKARQELEEYAKLWYKTKLGVLKKVLSAPLKALDIIVWKPAKYAFWHFFGKYFYLIWGILMLFVIIVVVVSAYKYLSDNYNDIVVFLTDAALSLWGSLLKTGGIIGQYLKPMFGETFMLLLTKVQDFVTSSLTWLWTSIVAMIKWIFNTIVDTITEKVASLLPGRPRIPEGITNAWSSLSGKFAQMIGRANLTKVNDASAIENSTQLLNITEFMNSSPQNQTIVSYLLYGNAENSTFSQRLGKIFS